MRLLLAVILHAVAAALAAAQLTVASTSPLLNANNVARTAPIRVTFDRALNTFTTSSAQFHAFGKQSGPIAGTLTFSNANRTLTLTPTRPFNAGESVMVLISHNLRAADGSFLRAQGYSFTFTVGVTPTYHRFELFDSFSNRDTPEDITRIYGGLACDLNRDGRLDLSTINQDSGDLRTFLHTGSYDTPYAAPVTPYPAIPLSSSPNDIADFNRDGLIDFITASDENKFAILRGNGDGTFQQGVDIEAGLYARGIVTLDADGDADFDRRRPLHLRHRLHPPEQRRRHLRHQTDIAIPGGPWASPPRT
jgi:hypothetical protein